MFLLFFLILLCSFPLFGYAAEVEDSFPPEFKAYYTLHAKGIQIGEGTRRLHKEGLRYVFASESHSVGLVALFRDDTIIERSEFLRDGNNLRPLHYLHKHTTGKKVRRHRELVFDWDTRQVRSVAPKRDWQLPMPATTLDNMLYQIMMMMDLQRGLRALEYQVADNRQIKTYTPEFLGEEKIDTGVGVLNTLKYRWASPENQHRVTTLWCAPKYHYLLARAEHVEKKGGTILRLKLQKVKGL